jgi:predicted O-methyltransferase YrrM
MPTLNATSLPDLSAWIARLFDCKDMLLMGHAQREEDANLGLGWLYYAMARTIRPNQVAVIGSYRGFVPLVLARALQDNGEGGVVHFVDPSLVDDFWKDPEAVRSHFESFGQRNIRHYPVTTQEFVDSEAYRGLGEVGLVFVDGYHTREQARFEFEAFLPLLSAQGVFIFHDSIRERSSGMYGEDFRYDHTVVRFIDELRQDPRYQVFDLMFADGATLVRRAAPPPPADPPPKLIR